MMIVDQHSTNRLSFTDNMETQKKFKHDLTLFQTIFYQQLPAIGTSKMSLR